MSSIDKITEAARRRETQLQATVDELKADLRHRDATLAQLTDRIETAERVAAKKVPKLRAPKRAKAAKHRIRVIIPDSHGTHIDIPARDAFLSDLKALCPDEVVGLGDHTDCGGTFSAHQITYTNEMVESYEEDCAQTNAFWDACQAYAPNAVWDILEGNHEAHIERWCARNVRTRRDAEFLLSKFGIEATMNLKHRGFRYFKSKEFHDGLSVRGTIRRGKCHFTHGISHSKNADDVHLQRFNGNVVFGHVHRALEVRSRTVTSSGHGAWCPGTLAKLQPLYRHTEPTTWTFGYGLQFVNADTGRFAHWNVPIFGDGTSGLAEAVGAFSRA